MINMTMGRRAHLWSMKLALEKMVRAHKELFRNRILFKRHEDHVKCSATMCDTCKGYSICVKVSQLKRLLEDFEEEDL